MNPLIIKRIAILLVFLLPFFQLPAQSSCLPGVTVVGSQAEVDSFPYHHPGCTEILGNFHIIGYGQIKNLDSLAQLERVVGYINLRFNDSLTSLQGLHNLQVVENGLTIAGNALLSNLNGLGSLDSVAVLNIEDNAAMSSLGGLSNLSWVQGGINISSNPALTDLTGLPATASGGGLYVADNGALTSLNGFPWDSLAGSLWIEGNDALTDLSGLDSLRYIGTGLVLDDNRGLIGLQGLERLDSIGGGLTITHNYDLINLEGLDGLRRIGGELRLTSNIRLANLHGLEQLEYIGGQFYAYNNLLYHLRALKRLKHAGSILLQSNNVLDHLDGLDSLRTLDGPLTIRNHVNLNDIQGIRNIDPATIDGSGFTDLKITGNTSLSACAILSVCGRLSLPGTLAEIENNASGCDSVPEVEAACLTGTESPISAAQPAITAYPNPFGATLHIQTKVSGQVALVNTVGQSIRVHSLHEGLNSIDTAGLPPGIYFLIGENTALKVIRR